MTTNSLSHSGENSMTQDDLVAKFHACAPPLGNCRRQCATETVLTLETVPSIKEVVSACT